MEQATLKRIMNYDTLVPYTSSNVCQLFHTPIRKGYLKVSDVFNYSGLNSSWQI